MSNEFKETWAEIWQGLGSYIITFAWCVLGFVTCIVLIYLTYRVMV